MLWGAFGVGCSLLGRVGSGICASVPPISRSILTAACCCIVSVMWLYMLRVVSALTCPIIVESVLMSIPFSSAIVANVAQVVESDQREARVLENHLQLAIRRRRIHRLVRVERIVEDPFVECFLSSPPQHLAQTWRQNDHALINLVTTCEKPHNSQSLVRYDIRHSRSVSRNISAFFVLLSIILIAPFIWVTHKIPQKEEKVQLYFDFFFKDFVASKLTFTRNCTTSSGASGRSTDIQ